MSSHPGPVLCFGEMLWDELSTGRRPGGAPMNVAFHLNRLGRPALPVSAVGDDVAGEDLLQFLRDRGVSTVAVAKSPRFPTGSVEVLIDERGDALYTIRQGVAWDEIPLTAEILSRAATSPALVFGSLAQRSASNRESLTKLRKAMGEGALLVFDVNLRAPFDDLDRVRSLAVDLGAGVIKCNHEEAARWTGGEAMDWEGNARRIASDSGVAGVCVTAGAHGAGLWWNGVWSQETGRPVTVVDTVGAGDAFLAALIDGLLAGLPAGEILARACRLGEWIASQSGATPDYEPERILGP
ncbi:MAG: carbohydrate kinase [Candidatus Methylacidiphilales bacterium]|nr:carbohydrate kinase [Candidatus Methylacidiphilales bacterium]